ncbi:MAG TPA: hypothetical protein VFC90_09290 [Planctomycetota bacterium]|nr:hypothetical protein [Planctomycetota bacterium]
MGFFGREEATEVEIAGKPLRCEICHHDKFWQRKGQLNTAVSTFFNFDWVNPEATCIICDHCGYIHWFLPR